MLTFYFDLVYPDSEVNIGSMLNPMLVYVSFQSATRNPTVSSRNVVGKLARAYVRSERAS